MKFFNQLLGCASAALIGIVSTSSAGAAEKCEWSFDPAQAYVGFTAYKFTEKTGVNARFLKHVFVGETKGSTVPEVLKGLRVEVDVASLETDNPGRNATIVQGFFKNLAGNMKVAGSVVKASGNASKGALVLALSMNGKTKNVPMSYAVSESGEFEAKGTIDVLKDFGAQKSFDALHELCRELHKGKDGVSKTWSEVTLVVRSPAQKACAGK
jgi:polyisoprenoid-binding protein YceI